MINLVKKLLDPNMLKQLFSYFFVGLGATVVEWVIFYLLNSQLQVHYAPATALAFAVSTFSNWLLGRLLTFKESKLPVLKELLSIYMASIVGLGFNLVLMYVFVDMMAIPEMFAKMMATGIVFFYNFFIRKLVIYRKK